MRKGILGFILGAVLATATVAGATGGQQVPRPPLRYLEQGNDGPTILIRGRGCLQQEDSMRIARGFDLVGDGKPGMTRDDLVVYHCIQP